MILAITIVKSQQTQTTVTPAINCLKLNRNGMLAVALLKGTIWAGIMVFQLMRSSLAIKSRASIPPMPNIWTPMNFLRRCKKLNCVMS
ncbi:hypothetical protein GJS26_02420 [Pectobacterium carotovorum subsp. carotovorum]|nr:hypothetical protein [Pectobacterium carotovorum subsp. carotovorum]